MHTVRIAIVGAGLSGLYAAYLLERQGITDYVLLEGREVLGGRIASTNATGQAVTHTTVNTDGIDRFDLGPTWFWPGYQRELDRLVEALGLERFEQFEEGDMVVERSPEEHPVRMRGYVNSPASMRLVGGMGSLIEALREKLAPANIITGHTVRRLRKYDGHIELESEDAAGHVKAWQAEHVQPCLHPWPNSGVKRERGWRPKPSTSPSMTRRSGGSRVCPGKAAVHVGRWVKSMTPPCPVAARRCLAFWVCRRKCAARSPTRYCAPIAVRNSSGCLVPRRRRLRPRPSRTGRKSRSRPLQSM